MSDTVFSLDVRGLRCPMPLLKLKQCLQARQVGDVVEVLTSDAGSLRDIPAFLRQSGHALLQQEERDGAFFFQIQKR